MPVVREDAKTLQRILESAFSIPKSEVDKIMASIAKNEYEAEGTWFVKKLLSCNVPREKIVQLLRDYGLLDDDISYTMSIASLGTQEKPVEITLGEDKEEIDVLSEAVEKGVFKNLGEKIQNVKELPSSFLRLLDKPSRKEE